MSTKTKSIFSGMGGLIGALAGLVTVAVGLLTLGSQLGWFDSGKGSSTARTGPGATPGDQQSGTNSGGSQGGSAAASAPPEFAVDPRTIAFQPGQPTEKSVTLRNTGKAPFVPETPELEGSDPDEFQVTNVNCAGTPVQPRSSCQVKIKFSPSQIGTYDAKVVIPISGSSRDAEVDVEGEKGLL
ncbi:MAG: choice-of-anchor D domain-containing protein [Actinomycetota bacterium]|nr:choice-of-anchor D domain-containing protein [Actinomycetota bacterium]